jgi:AFG3 family protein
VSSGALDDLEKVTKQAYTMVAFYGLDPEMGNISYYDSTGEYEQSLQKPYSEATAQLIDREVRELVESSYARTKQILTEHRDEMEKLARRLLEKRSGRPGRTYGNLWPQAWQINTQKHCK